MRISRKDHYDVAIVGGGLAGSALAALLAEQGHSVALIERDRFPRPKLCGEFLSPAARPALERLGCLGEVLAAAPARIAKARFTLASRRVLELPLSGEGLGLSRRTLDAILFRRAAACGAAAFEGLEAIELKAGALTLRPREARSEGDNERVPIELRSDLLVLAHGRRARLDSRLARPFLREEHPFLAWQIHLAPVAGEAGARLRSELAGTVELHVLRGGYCGLSEIEGGRVNACALLHRAELPSASERAGGWDAIAESLGARNPLLAERLSALAPTGEPLQTIAGIPLGEKGAASDLALHVGDAAAMVAPLCGGGQAMALRSALLLADLIAERGTSRGEQLELAPLASAWERRWRAEFAARLRLGRRLQAILLRPRLAAFAFGALARRPRWAARLLRAVGLGDSRGFTGNSR